MPRLTRQILVQAFTVVTLLLLGTPVSTAQNPKLRKASTAKTPSPEYVDLVRRITEAEAKAQAARDAVEAANRRASDLERQLGEVQRRLTDAERELERTRPATALARQEPAQQENQDESKPETVESLGERLGKLEEKVDLNTSRLQEHSQTRVETAEKFYVKLSGMVLFNSYYNSAGTFDSPTGLWLLPPANRTIENGSNFGTTIRQSQIGFAFRAPKIGRWNVSGDVSMDFFGGNAPVYNGRHQSVFRLRTARIKLESDRLDFVVGQDEPIISPLSPTSLAQVGFPALSESGNLWTWVPQAKVAYRLRATDTDRLTFEAGILSPTNGPFNPAFTGVTRPDAGERGRVPAVQARLSYRRGVPSDTAYLTFFDPQPFQVGVGGHYARALAAPGVFVDSTAVAGDYVIPLGPRATLSGELFWGKALGGLGGGIGQSIITPDLGPRPIGIRTRGGWVQLQVRPHSDLSLNFAYGMDDPLNRDLVGANLAAGGGAFAVNRTGSANLLYRFRSNVIFSVEYRRMNTGFLLAPARSNNHFNLGVGYLF